MGYVAIISSQSPVTRSVTPRRVSQRSRPHPKAWCPSLGLRQAAFFCIGVIRMRSNPYKVGDPSHVSWAVEPWGPASF